MERNGGSVITQSKSDDSASDVYKPMLARLASRLNVAQQRALMQGGALGLFACLEEEREEALPEIKRKRPKVSIGNYVLLFE